MEGDKERLERQLDLVTDELRKLKSKQAEELEEAYHLGYKHGYGDGESDFKPPTV